MTFRRIGQWLVCWTGLMIAPFVGAQPEVGPKSAVLELAVLEAPAGTALADILSGEARVGFTPLLTPGAPLRLSDGTSHWLRLRAELPAHADGEWLIRLERTPLQTIRLYLPETPGRAQYEAGFFRAGPTSHRLGAGLRLPLPAGAAGEATWYLEVQGEVAAGLLPQLVNTAAADALDARTRTWLQAGLAGLLLVVVLGLVRVLQRPTSGAGSVVFAALSVGLAGLALSGDLYQWPAAAALGVLGPMGLWTLLLLPIGPLLLATATYSGLPYSLPKLMPYVRSTALAMPGVALLVLMMRPELAASAQVLVWLAWLLLPLVCLILLLLDSRTYRWAPIGFWAVLMGLLWLRAGVELQWVNASEPLLRGHFPVWGLLLLGMVLLPWLRSAMQQRQMQKRAVVVELSSAEKIDAARKHLLDSLQAGLGSAAEGDVEWIAFRRLLTGLKPVLPQMSSAVMAMNYRAADLLQVEPLGAEERYRTLLAQRSSLLRGLSRSRGAQQIALDFDGPDGPLPPVQLAVIPLPIEKPGWGVLLVERPAGISYSEEELEMCTEFASLATTASDEAAVSVKSRHEAEIDPDTGVYRSEMIGKLLQHQIELARLQIQPVTLLRVDIDGMTEWLAEQETAATEALSRIAGVLRDELEFGESIGRLGPASFLLLLHGRNANVCRPVADRIMAALVKLGLPDEVKACIGISELRRGEIVPGPLLERAGHAVLAARRNGTPASA